MMDNKLQDNIYKVVDGIIYYKDHIYLVHESTLKEKVLKAMHDAPLVGQPRYFKNYRKITERFTWKGLKDDVLRHVRECMTCEKNKYEKTHQMGLLQTLPIWRKSGKVYTWTSSEVYQRY
jgi:hypothetical protein